MANKENAFRRFTWRVSGSRSPGAESPVPTTSTAFMLAGTQTITCYDRPKQQNDDDSKVSKLKNVLCSCKNSRALS